MARTNLLAVVIAAEANLAAVADTNFTLSLTAAETRASAVTLDYGDLQMLRAMLQSAEYVIYNTYDWNLDLQLTALRALATNAPFNVEALFLQHPSLLTFATTNDLSAAKTVFTNGVARYLAASQFIRGRTNVTRLFNYDPSEAGAEQNFRQTLLDLQNSFNGVVTLAASPGYSVFMPSLFDGRHPLRSFLPQLHSTGFALGTLPDATFGGAIFGVQADSAEQFLAGFLTPFPDIPTLAYLPSQAFTFQINCVKDQGYVIQVSTNLINWLDYIGFISPGSVQTFTEPAAQLSPRRFYRVVERPPAQFPPPLNDSFANRTLLTGTNVTGSGSNCNATREPGEPFHWSSTGGKSVWWTWQAPKSGTVTISTAGSSFDTILAVYTGDSVGGLTLVQNNDDFGGWTSQVSFSATSGTVYQIAVDGYAAASGSILLRVQQ